MNNSSFVIVLLLLGSVAGTTAQNVPEVPVSQRTMPWTPELFDKVMKEHRSAPEFVPADSGPQPRLLPTSVNLYPLLDNVPIDRNQHNCGNCWVWGCTGTMEIALNVQNGIRDRLSTQFITSCDTAMSPCNGGSFSDFRAFYRLQGFALPWSNNNADYCGSQTCRACGNISTAPRYRISNIDYYSIPTWNGQSNAIYSVKKALSENKGLYFYFYLPTYAAWSVFDDFFYNKNESVVWSSFYCGVTPDGGAQGHVVLCVGYYDDGGANQYWIMLNSWGAPSGRPTGLFHVAMNVDYNCSGSSSGFGFEGISVGFNLPPVITNQPQSMVITQANNAGFSVATEPGTPLTYQWQKDGTNVNNNSHITGATTTALALSNVTANDAGDYTVLLNYGAGISTSAVATLTVLVAPTITNQPQSGMLCQGNSDTLTVGAAGTTPSYRWRWNNSFVSLPSPGATSWTAWSAGSYSCVVSNCVAMVTSDVAVLTLSYPPVITNQPQSASLLQGNCTLFTLAASGTPPLYYQWHWNNFINPWSPTALSWNVCNAGSYWCVVSNTCGLATSGVAVLTFTNPLPGHIDLITRLGDGTMRLDMSGTPNTNYTILATADLNSWPRLCTLPSSNGLFQWTDCAASSNAHRFYRLRPGP